MALSAGYKELAAKIALWSCIELRAEVNRIVHGHEDIFSYIVLDNN